jgi:hypothetical protein
MSCGDNRLRPFERIRYIIAVGIICPGSESGWKQTQDWATTDDGSKLYFSSTLRLAGTEEYGNCKIFEYGNNSYAVVARSYLPPRYRMVASSTTEPCEGCIDSLGLCGAPDAHAANRTFKGAGTSSPLSIISAST